MLSLRMQPEFKNKAKEFQVSEVEMVIDKMKKYYSMRVRNLMTESSSLASSMQCDVDMDIFSARFAKLSQRYVEQAFNYAEVIEKVVLLVSVNNFGNVDVPVISPEVAEVISHADNEAESMGFEFIGMGHIFLSILNQRNKGVFDNLPFSYSKLRTFILGDYRVHSIALEEAV